MPLGIIDTKDTVPGTVLLRDDGALEDTSGLKHGKGKDSHIVLVPQPSSDPNDPLNWPRWKKDFVFSVFFVSTVVLASVPSPMLASATVVLSKELKKTLDEIAELSGYQLLVVGCLGPIVSALASKYGKRPQFVFAAIMALIGTSVCIGAHDDYDALLAGRLIQGFGTTAFESLSISALGDIYFVHERPFRTGIMVLSLTCVSSLASIIGGPITAHLGWRYMFIVHLPFVIVCMLGIIFFVPETQYKRYNKQARGSADDHIHDQSALQPEVDKNESKTIEHTKEEAADGESIPPKKTFIQEMAVFNGTFTDENLLELIVAPLLTMLNPVVIWALFVTGITTALYVGTAYISAQVLSAPPYLLTPAGVGYFFTGSLIGGVTGGLAGAWICKATTDPFIRLNRGTYEPEFRIPCQIISAFCLGLGWFVWMWQVSHATPHGYYLGAFCYGTVCFGLTLSAISATLYILDTYRDQSNEIFIFLMLAKNLLFYGFSTFINTWTAQEGARQVFKVFGTTSLCLIATCVPMYIFGKLMRRVPLLGLKKRR